MMVIAVSQLISRALSYALIAASFGKRHAMLAVAFELAIYVLYKLARRDFSYSVVNVSGWKLIFTSLAERLSIKVSKAKLLLSFLFSCTLLFFSCTYLNA
jgi:hypothetical protein